NAERLGLSSRSSFRTGHWLEGITEKFDAIISNPPYIPSREIPELMPEVREHDPLLALDGGKDGLDVYRFLAPQMRDYLRSNGFVIFEVGAGQAEDV
ncbi:peptide chain release factor N(5)-glutamine methyltransferase, partial [Acinetobacter baumannii]